MDIDHLKVKDNKELNRFELSIDSLMAKIDYKEGKQGWIYLVHTEVPEELTSQGVGHKLVRDTLSLLDQRKKKIVPLCPFIQTYIRKSPATYEHMLAESVKL